MKLTVMLVILFETTVIVASEGDDIVISVTPDTDQYVSVDSLANITFLCNVTGREVTTDSEAVWEVDGRMITFGENPIREVFQDIGIFVDQLMGTLIILTVNREARLLYMETGLVIRCVALNPPVSVIGQSLFIRTYGRPEVPGDLAVSIPTLYLTWSRPANIPAAVQVNYTVTINSTTSELGGVFLVGDEMQFSLQFLEEALAVSEDCEVFAFYVSASAADTEDSLPAVITETLPVYPNVRPIDSSLKVVSVSLQNAHVSATISFQALVMCSSNFPIRTYTLLLDDAVGVTMPATPSDSIVVWTVTSDDSPILVLDMAFQIGVRVCSDDVVCIESRTVPLYTSDVQAASVIFFENNVFLSCTFADGSIAKGCVFTFQANQNGIGNDQFVLLRSLGTSQQCNMTTNQREGYVDISVQDLESDGTSLGQLSRTVNTVVLENETLYIEMTGCTDAGQGDLVPIIVPVVVGLLVLESLWLY